MHKLVSNDHIVQASVVERDLLRAWESLLSDGRIATAASSRDEQIVRLACSWHERDAVFTVNSGLILNGSHAGQNDVILI